MVGGYLVVPMMVILSFVLGSTKVVMLYLKVFEIFEEFVLLLLLSDGVGFMILSVVLLKLEVLLGMILVEFVDVLIILALLLFVLVVFTFNIILILFEIGVLVILLVLFIVVFVTLTVAIEFVFIIFFIG